MLELGTLRYTSFFVRRTPAELILSETDQLFIDILIFMLFPSQEKGDVFYNFYKEIKFELLLLLFLGTTSRERDKTRDLQFMGCYFLLLQMFFSFFCSQQYAS